MAITVKEKELTAVAISVATGCKPCTDYHVKAVREAGASDDEIRQAVADALSVRQSATAIMARHALAHLGKVGAETENQATEQTDRIKTLVAIGAAFGVNCVSNLEEHLATAEAVGISQEDIVKVTRLAAYIKKRAASHVERRVGMAEEAA
jgi:AhpD family alkylhydroperoxidase